MGFYAFIYIYIKYVYEKYLSVDLNSVQNND